MGKLSYRPLGFCFVLAACASQAQHVTRVYNRDNYEDFKLKDVTGRAVVKGPIVTQEAVFDFENPYDKLTEASFWFDLDPAAILSGFGYWYKDEYVPGQLMDKNKAWFIYTAITSRNEDPGIMTQVSPGSYHAQIYPLATGHDLRVKLTSVGFLKDNGGKLTVSPLTYNEQTFNPTVTSTQPETLVPDVSATPPQTVVQYPSDPGSDIQWYAQRHKDGYTYVAGLLRTSDPDVRLRLKGIHRVYWEAGDDTGAVKLFVGRRKGPGTVRVSVLDANGREVKTKYIKANERGSDTAKLWAHQRLVHDESMDRRDVLNFSLRYEIPSSETALLAVPQEEMELFKKKAAEYRRKQSEDARRQREWQNDRQQNWSNSSGGDPEIRVFLPNAVRVYAELPDGRTFDLVKSRNGYWGGNYDIPADAPEGQYVVEVHSFDRSGQESVQTISYQVDRTAPTGSLKAEDGYLVLRSEEGLGRAVIVFGDGTEETMLEVTPGVYKLSTQGKRVVKVVLMDRAHNLAELPWSP